MVHDLLACWTRHIIVRLGSILITLNRTRGEDIAAHPRSRHVPNEKQMSARQLIEFNHNDATGLIMATGASIEPKNV